MSAPFGDTGEDTNDAYFSEFLQNELGTPMKRNNNRKTMTSVQPAVSKNAAPVPQIDSIRKAVLGSPTKTGGLGAEEREQFVENMHTLIVTARKQINELKEKNEELQKRIDSGCIIKCPSCLFMFNEKDHEVLPKYMKIIRPRCRIEMEFHSMDDLYQYAAANRITHDQNGTPVQVPIRKPVVTLADAGSRLPEYVKEQEETHPPIKLRISLKKGAQPAVQHQQQPSPADQVAARKPVKEVKVVSGLEVKEKKELHSQQNQILPKNPDKIPPQRRDQAPAVRKPVEPSKATDSRSSAPKAPAVPQKALPEKTAVSRSLGPSGSSTMPLQKKSVTPVSRSSASSGSSTRPLQKPVAPALPTKPSQPLQQKPRNDVSSEKKKNADEVQADKETPAERVARIKEAKKGELDRMREEKKEKPLADRLKDLQKKIDAPRKEAADDPKRKDTEKPQELVKEDIQQARKEEVPNKEPVKPENARPARRSIFDRLSNATAVVPPPKTVQKPPVQKELHDPRATLSTQEWRETMSGVFQVDTDKIGLDLPPKCAVPKKEVVKIARPDPTVPTPLAVCAPPLSAPLKEGENCSPPTAEKTEPRRPTSPLTKAPQQEQVPYSPVRMIRSPSSGSSVMFVSPRAARYRNRCREAEDREKRRDTNSGSSERRRDEVRSRRREGESPRRREADTRSRREPPKRTSGDLEPIRDARDIAIEHQRRKEKERELRPLKAAENRPGVEPPRRRTPSRERKESQDRERRRVERWRGPNARPDSYLVEERPRTDERRETRSMRGGGASMSRVDPRSANLEPLGRRRSTRKSEESRDRLSSKDQTPHSERDRATTKRGHDEDREPATKRRRQEVEERRRSERRDGKNELRKQSKEEGEITEDEETVKEVPERREKTKEVPERRRDSERSSEVKERPRRMVGQPPFISPQKQKMPPVESESDDDGEQEEDEGKEVVEEADSDDSATIEVYEDIVPMETLKKTAILAETYLPPPQQQKDILERLKSKRDEVEVAPETKKRVEEEGEEEPMDYEDEDLMEEMVVEEIESPGMSEKMDNGNVEEEPEKDVEEESAVEGENAMEVENVKKSDSPTEDAPFAMVADEELQNPEEKETEQDVKMEEEGDREDEVEKTKEEAVEDASEDEEEEEAEMTSEDEDEDEDASSSSGSSDSSDDEEENDEDDLIEAKEEDGQKPSSFAAPCSPKNESDEGEISDEDEVDSEEDDEEKERKKDDDGEDTGGDDDFAEWGQVVYNEEDVFSDSFVPEDEALEEDEEEEEV